MAICASVKSCRNMFIFAIANVVGFNSCPNSFGARPFRSGWRCSYSSRALMSNPAEPQVGSYTWVNGAGSISSAINQPTSFGV